MAEMEVLQLKEEVVTLQRKVDGLEHNRFGVLEVKVDTNRALLEQNDKTVQKLFEEQSKRVD